jgi:ribosomal protein RSM22 (predicted rRNA methylase)
MPAIFQVNQIALATLVPLRLRIASVLDLGCGPGTATIAARESFEGLQKATLIDRDDGWFDLGERTLATIDSDLRTRFVKAAIERENSFDQHDLAIISYALGELPSSDARNVVKRAWDAARMAIAIVEPGTPRGFTTILAARAELIAAGAAIVAPCTHGFACPLANGDWCHFDTRIDRTQRHRIAKSGTLPYEVEKFSYLVATRSAPGTSAPASRIIKHPLKRGGHVVLDLCTSQGTAERIVVSRRDKDTYRDARDAQWGDLWLEGDDNQKQNS